MREIDIQQKVALVGTSCTGKTVIFDRLRKDSDLRKKRVGFVSEAARIFFERNDVFDRFSEETQGQIQRLALILEKRVHDKKVNSILCDRSVLDAVAYVRSTGDYSGASRLFNIVRFWIPTYTNILLLDPQGVQFANDSIRGESEDTRQKFHNSFLELFSEQKINYELLGGTEDSRTNYVKEILKRGG